MRKTPQPGLPRPLARAGLFLSLLLAGGVAVAAEAVKNPNVFEVDGNAHEQAPAGDDWETIAPSGTGGGALRDTFITDSVTGDDRIFTGGGSKDVRDVSQWGSTTGEPPDKNDIEHAYAAAYSVNNELIIYFGLDRFSTDGDSAMGFWFFKNEIGTTTNGFSGVHAVGDILVTSDNVNGGSVSVINVFKWVGGQNPLQLLASSTSGGGNTDANGVFCLNNTYACAVRNSSAQPVPDSWGGFTFKGAGAVDDFPQFSFYEGGVNITALLNSNGGGNTETPCFASFMAMTRTSASETAQLKDFALGAFPLCGITVGKSCYGDPTISTDGLSINYTFAVPVTNTGVGTVYDVALEEDSVLGGTFATTCKIDGTSVTQNQAVAVFTSIAAGATDTAYITCNSKANGLVNAVTARAKTSAGASTRDLEASHTTGEGETCSADISRGLLVTKECNTDDPQGPTGVRIVPGGFEVCVDITVKNTSTEALNQLSVIDARFTNPNLVTNGTLAPGVTLELLDKCYTATAPDGTGTPPVAEDTPSAAGFSNGVQVQAFGALTGLKVGDASSTSAYEATATCPLCPCSGPGCE